MYISKSTRKYKEEGRKKARYFYAKRQVAKAAKAEARAAAKAAKAGSNVTETPCDCCGVTGDVCCNNSNVNVEANGNAIDFSNTVTIVNGVSNTVTIANADTNTDADADADADSNAQHGRRRRRRAAKRAAKAARRADAVLYSGIRPLTGLQKAILFGAVTPVAVSFVFFVLEVINYILK